MGYTFDNVLADELVTEIERDDESGRFVVQIGGLQTRVTIELERAMNSDKTKFRVSHAIKTPLQAAPYRTSTPVGEYPGYALHRAINGLTSHYSEAVNNDYEPSEDWLVPC